MLETFRHLAQREFEASWIVENLISPGGWTLLVGETKLGKSMLMIQLCEALQTGKEFLGRKTLKSNCLYVQCDAGLIEWHEQIRRLAPESRAWTMHQLDSGWLDSEVERRRLHEIVWGNYTEEVQGYKAYHNLSNTLRNIPFTFVVFDCLHALTHEDLNSRFSMTSVLSHLDEIVTRRIEKESGVEVERVHYLMIHHPNATQKRGATAGAGNKAFSALCTTKLSLLPGMLVLDGSKLAPNQEIALERAENGAWILPYSYEEVETEVGVTNDYEDLV